LNLFFREITEHNVEYVQYSFFQDGDELKSFESFRCKESNLLKIYDYDCELHSKRLKVIEESKIIASTYVISMVGVFSKEFFLKVLSLPPAQPRWHIKTPFDFERDGYSTDLLPMTRGVLKFELFASIDDDHGNPGTSLIARGLYANRVPRKKLIKKNRYATSRFKNISLKILFKFYEYIYR
jgi:hypothetical protein